MRTKSRCFSNNRRAIVLEYVDEPVEEPMPMIDKVRVDKTIMDLVMVLRRSPEIKVEGHTNNKLRVTLNGRSTLIPAKYEGHSVLPHIKQSLASIDIHLNGEGLPTPTPGMASVATLEVQDISALPDTKQIIGIQLSDDTLQLLVGAMASYRRDFEKEVDGRIDAGVNEMLGDLLSVRDRFCDAVDAA